MQVLSQCLERLYRETLPSALFTQLPVLRFRPENEDCLCAHKLKVQKTRQKTVLSMTTPFIAHETVLECPKCKRVFASEDLRRIVPSRCNVAWDVVVFVGRSLFEQHKNVEQVRKELLVRNIDLCSSEIDYLGQKFITYLAVSHRQAAPRINQSLQLAGGYILHLDATHEADAPALMTGLDSLSEFVLGNVKIPSERSDYIVPFLEQLRNDYGTPVACVHDMGTGICKAVAEVFPDTRDFICHFHFLRDVGSDLITPSYGQLRSYLRKHSATTWLNALVRQVGRQLGDHQYDDAQQLVTVIKDLKPPKDMVLLPLVSTYALALWCLHGKKSGDGYGFPFDRPLMEFARRLLVLINQLPELIQQLPADDRVGNQIFHKFASKVIDIVRDPIFLEIFAELHWRCQLFDDLRDKMRIALPGDARGLNDEGCIEMESIREGVGQFRSKLDDDEKFAVDPLCCKVAKQIDQYGDKLFADPIVLNPGSQSEPTITIYPQRTNNILEQFFRRLRRGHRMRTGNNSMRRSLQAMLADTPLVKNLSNSKYMTILLDGKSSLEELFAKIEIEGSPLGMDAPTNTENILPGFLVLAKLPNLPTKIAQVVSMA